MDRIRDRMDKEIRILQALVNDLTNGNPLEIVNQFKHDWNALYQLVQTTNGWDALTDLHIDLLYQWFEEKNFFEKY